MKIKYCFKKAPLITLGHEEYRALQKQLTGVGITTDIVEVDFHLRHPQAKSIPLCSLRSGDIIFNDREPRQCKVIGSLPEGGPVYAGPSYFVLRPLSDFPPDIKPIPAWAIVVTARQVGNLWCGMGQFTKEHMMNYKFETVPEENPKGIQVLDHIEKLLTLKAQVIQTVEEIHRAVAYRMLKNEPLTGALTTRALAEI